ncbi:MAG: hypothetical protein ACRCW2_08695 [Cellulosilyticaceae bacterium]
MAYEHQDKEQLKDQLRICYSKLAVLEKPTQLTAYNRNEADIAKKRQHIEEEMLQIKQQIKKLQ